MNAKKRFFNRKKRRYFHHSKERNLSKDFVHVGPEKWSHGYSKCHSHAHADAYTVSKLLYQFS